jgi:hypothetical protein
MKLFLRLVVKKMDGLLGGNKLILINLEDIKKPTDNIMPTLRRPLESAERRIDSLLDGELMQFRLILRIFNDRLI